jgi:hypothetical protein
MPKSPTRYAASVNGLVSSGPQRALALFFLHKLTLQPAIREVVPAMTAGARRANSPSRSARE